MRASIALGAALFSSAVALVGCGGKSNNETAGDGGGTPTLDATVADAGHTPLPCDVQAVLSANCWKCHGETTENTAPMSIVTWEDVQRATPPDSTEEPAVAGEPVYKAIETRIHDATNPMPQPPNALLGQADQATLDSWIAAGAPAGSGTCGDLDASVPDAAPPTIECEGSGSELLTVAPSSPFAMPVDKEDDYVCFGFNAPSGSAAQHILAVTPHIDNSKIVHHVLLYEADQPFSTTPTECSPAGSLGWRVVYGWAPGGGAMATPPNVGFPYDSTTNFVVQVHYNNINQLSNQTDSTGFSMCATDQPVQYNAGVMAFGVGIPAPQDPTTDHPFDIPPLATTDLECSYTIPSTLDGVHVFAAFPHMHQLGSLIETEQSMSNGGIVDLGMNAPWSFTNQVWFPVVGTLHQGDVVTTRCAWNNTTDQTVTFGQNTENEMCYSFTSYYPAPTSTASWEAQALASTCTHTPAAGLPTPDGGWVIQGDSGATFTPIDSGTPVLPDSGGASDAGAGQ